MTKSTTWHMRRTFNLFSKPNKKISVFQMTGLKNLGMVGIFF